MAKRIVRSIKPRKQHLFSDIHEQCPPESPHQLYVNAALEAVGESYGAFMNDLSEEVAQLIINVATTAAYATLEAAQVSDEWSDAVKPAKVQRSAPVWADNVINGPVSVYQAMAWAYQERKHPKLFNDAYNEAYQAELVETIDAMLKFALTAAGVDGAWDRAYEAVARKLG